MNEVRTERTHGIRAGLDASARGSLLQIRHMPGYEVLLDLMEQACIEQESKLILSPVSEPDKIVAEHRLAQAYWQVFVTLQQKVERELAEHLGQIADRKYRVEQEESFDEDQQILRP